MNEIKVHVVKYPDRDNLVMRYLCPLTNKHVSRSTRTRKKSEAVKVAAKWEAELQEGRYQKRQRMPWDEFRVAYEIDGTAGLRPKTVQAYCSTLNAMEKHCRPKTVADLTTAKVTTFARELRLAKLTEASVARHLRHLKAICRWGNRQGFLSTVPTFDMPKRGSGATKMKGRPITDEEFEWMLEFVPKVMGEAAAESWVLFLRGLWASGLRVGEALSLRWDDKPGCVTVHLDGYQSVMSFDADSQKSGKVGLSPLAPEAVKLLEPLQRDRGYVFNLLGTDGKPMLRRAYLASKYAARIGKRAGVIVDAELGKYASAHDLRRSFGVRWSRRLNTIQLKELMRHSSVATTLTYYVGQNAKETAADLWRALGNNLGNNESNGLKDNPLENRKNPTNAGLK